MGHREELPGLMGFYQKVLLFGMGVDYSSIHPIITHQGTCFVQFFFHLKDYVIEV